MIVSKEIISQIGNSQLTEDDIIAIQNKTGFTINPDIANFLTTFSDCFLKDCFFESPAIYVSPSYICGKSNNNPNIYDLIDGNAFYSYKEWLPFAVDSGGWVFNISFNINSYHQIWIDKFDNGESNPFVYVAPSLDFFLNNLLLG